MPFYRLSFIFTAGKQGWSEQWYVDYSGPPDTLLSAVLPMNFFNNFLGPRAIGVLLRAIRITDTSQKRRSFLQVLNLNSGMATLSKSQAGEEPSVAVLGYCLTTQTYKRPVMLRGLIDAEVNRDSDDNVIFPPELTQPLAFWVQAIIDAGFLVRVLAPADQVGNPDRQVTAMQPTTNDAGSTTILYKSNLQLVDNSLVILHGISRKFMPGYSGPLPNENTTPTSTDVPIQWRSLEPIIYTRQASIRNAAYIYDSVASIAWEDMRTKKTGRPTLLSRGRQTGVAYRSR